MNIFQYIQGIRTGKEANHTEFEAMKDAFLADALDGYTETKGSHKKQIDKLQNTVTRKCQKKSNYGLIGGIAAAAGVILGIGIYFLVLEPDAAKNLFASNKPKTAPKEQVLQTQPATQTHTEEIKSEPVAEKKNQVVKPVESPPVVATPQTSVSTNKPETTVTDSRPQSITPPVSTTTSTSTVSTEKPVAPTQTTTATTERKEDSPTQIIEETPATPTAVSENPQEAITSPATEQPAQPVKQEESARPKIKGKVTDKNGNALAGASVSVLGANKRTTTNANGYFEVEAEDNSNIMVRSLGFDPVMLTGSPGQNLHISMEEVPKE